MAALLLTLHPGRFKAVVMHSGIPPGKAHSALTAQGAMRGQRPSLSPVTSARLLAAAWPPLLVIHGNADTAAAMTWAQAAGAQVGPPRQAQRGKRYPMTVTDYKRRGTLVATLVQVSSLGHAWSGGAANQPYSDAQGPDASRLAWAFASRQFRN